MLLVAQEMGFLMVPISVQEGGIERILDPLTRREAVEEGP